MKILIADDEELVRVGLRDILRRIAQGDEISEAVNGRELIESARAFRPDICFVDIRMPGISGLEAIEKLTVDFPDMGWIILSGYSDFEYARRALTLGVTDYLLKPATEVEVEQALLKATRKRLDAGRLKREKFEYRVGGVINNSSAVEFDDFLQQLDCFIASVFIPDLIDDAESLRIQRNIISNLRNRFDHNPMEEHAGLFNIPDGYLAVIAAGKEPAGLLDTIEGDLPALYSEAGRMVRTPEFCNLQELLAFFETSSEFRGLPVNSVDEDSSGSSSRIVRQAEKLVHDQYSKPIGVAQIAEQLNITPNYLSSLFKKYKGVSFTKFITEMRLNKAPDLLDIPGITVKEAARNLGYMSSRHFARLFREKYGMAPTDYINRDS